MIENYVNGIKQQKTPRIPRLKKQGTVKISAVEATPVVWKDRLLRFEWLRSSAWDTFHKQRAVGSYQFFDMETEEPVGAEFAFDHAFGCCYEENGVMYAHGVRGSDGATNVIDVFWSSDLTEWESRTALVLPDTLKVFNASVSFRRAARHTYGITGGIGHVPRSTSASKFFGSARLRFSVMPPPVICASACTAGRFCSMAARTGFT
jgi:hypothetical protein